MKKAERLNQELIYLSYKKLFNLKELQEEFHISERTALRDIKDLEKMGLSLYVNKGRYGAYHLTHERLWTPIRFSLEEMNAIFFALKALKRMSTTPFSNSYKQIYLKLMNSLPKAKRDEIKNKQKYVSYREQPTLHKIKYFKKLLYAVENNTVLEIENHQYFTEKRKIQISEIFYQTGNWFCVVYDLKSNNWYILRCDKIIYCQLLVNEKSKNRNWLIKSFNTYQHLHYRYSFKCKLSQLGKEKVLLNLYPKMKITEHNGECYLEGKFAKADFDYLVDYLISLGDNIKIVSPQILQKAYLNKLNSIIKQYK